MSVLQHVTKSPLVQRKIGPTARRKKELTLAEQNETQNQRTNQPNVSRIERWLQRQQKQPSLGRLRKRCRGIFFSSKNFRIRIKVYFHLDADVAVVLQTKILRFE